MYCSNGPARSLRCVDQSEAELKGGGGYTHTHTHTQSSEEDDEHGWSSVSVKKTSSSSSSSSSSLLWDGRSFLCVIEVFSEREKHESVGLWIHFSLSSWRRRLPEGRNISCSTRFISFHSTDSSSFSTQCRRVAVCRCALPKHCVNWCLNWGKKLVQTHSTETGEQVLTRFVCRLDHSCSVECVQWTESSGAGPSQGIVFFYSRAFQEYLHFLYFTLPLLYILETILYFLLHYIYLNLSYFTEVCVSDWTQTGGQTDVDL